MPNLFQRILEQPNSNLRQGTSVEVPSEITEGALTAEHPFVPEPDYCQAEFGPLDNLDFEFQTVAYSGIAPNQSLADYQVKLRKPRKYFYLVSMKPSEATWMHFIPLHKYDPTAGWAGSDGTESWIPFAKANSFAQLGTGGITDVATIELDTAITKFYVSQLNAAGGVPHAFTILCSSIRLTLETTKTS